MSQIPWQLEEELEAFMEWSATPIQLDRDTKYKACQSATLGSNKEAILCYMGYLTKFKAVPPNQLSITFFRQPSLFAAFISYVLARSVGRGWIARHLSIAKKVGMERGRRRRRRRVGVGKEQWRRRRMTWRVSRCFLQEGVHTPVR